ncbi:MAG: dxr [Chlamydiales bacterium]|jgi:1-deoxy-D-xylulose-5-phosphate reductoisomerase|nr:dxr [Chlamydiales bacterium]
MKRISILGSTGSIGRQALQVVDHFKEQFEVVALAAHSNIDLLQEQIARYRPKFVALFSEEQALALKKRGVSCPVEGGMSGVKAVAAAESDLVIASISGTLGIEPTLAAIEAGRPVALANKETLVSAGQLIMPRAAAKGVEILPVDSEHNALFQCLHGSKIADVDKLWLTCSGGPFYGRTKKELEHVTLEDALQHPKWQMGVKNTIDSSTLMNKGLEVIEAHWLFQMPLKKIDVVVHPEALFHSFVSFCDGSILGQMNEPSMIIPIQYAMTYPERFPSFLSPFDFKKAFNLHFSPPDLEAFPALKIAYDALQAGHSYPAYMNAANEILVARFVSREIRWHEIAEKLQTLLQRHSSASVASIESVLAIDAAARADALLV